MSQDTSNPLPDNFDAEFEDLYRRFVAAGGIDPGLPAIAEDWERDAREDRDGHKPTRCPHGKTLLTCEECYFNQGRMGYSQW